MHALLKRRQLIFTAAALGGTVLLPACGGGGDDDGDNSGGSSSEQRSDLMKLAESKPELSIFVEACGAAGLRDTIANGTHTLFCPNNDAFNAYFAEVGKSKDAVFADKATLDAILKFCILNSLLLKAAFRLGWALEPWFGAFFKIEKEGEVYKCTDGRNRVCNVVSTDSIAANGALHICDRVMLPPNKDCETTVETTVELNILASLVIQVGMTETLKAPGQITVFCPTNDAFAALLVELNITLEALKADLVLLRRLVNCHILSTRKLRAEFDIDVAIPTQEPDCSIKVNGNRQVTDQRGRVCNIKVPDVCNTNGVIHHLDKCMLPPA